jgi:hypothetical protein
MFLLGLVFIGCDNGTQDTTGDDGQVYSQGDTAIDITDGDILDKNDLDWNDNMGTWIKVGSITSNKITLTFPAVNDGILRKRNGKLVGWFDNWKTKDGKKFEFMNLSENKDVLTYYSKEAVTGFEIEGERLTLKPGWNIIISTMGDDHSVFDGTFDDLYKKGFKWYLKP